jgi:mannose-6-phosphate isomerase-like protein (cupin superfamily)
MTRAGRRRIAAVAGYTIKNLKEIEDQAPKFGLAPNLEFRVAGDPLEAEQSAISYLKVAPTYRLAFGHTHREQEEIYLLVGGGARIKLDDEVLELRPWDAVRIAKDTTRNVEAGPEGAELILFGAPKTGPGDAEVEPEWWTD